MVPALRRYVIELGGALLLYVSLLLISLVILRTLPMPPAARMALSLLPMPAFALCGWAVVRQVRRLDEFQRQLQLEALAIAFVGTAMITFGYGFLEGVGAPRLSMFAVWPAMSILWIAGLYAASHHYRR